VRLQGRVVIVEVRQCVLSHEFPSVLASEKAGLSLCSLPH
jgi:hypothetical protein